MKKHKLSLPEGLALSYGLIILGYITFWSLVVWGVLKGVGCFMGVVE